MKIDGIMNLLQIHKVDKNVAEVLYLDYKIYNKQLKRENIIDHILYDQDIDESIHSNNSWMDTMESKIYSKEFNLKPLISSLEEEVYFYFNNLISNAKKIIINYQYKTTFDISNHIMRDIMMKCMIIERDSRRERHYLKIICGFNIYDYLSYSTNLDSSGDRLNGIDIYLDYKIDPYSVVISVVHDSGGYILMNNEEYNMFCINSTPNIDRLSKIIKFEII